MKRLIYAISALAAIATSCREDELVVPTEYDILPVPTQPGAVPRGMYLLNEGNMGSNKSSIDYVDFRNALYSRNMYAQANPSVVMELGDVGNDIAIYPQAHRQNRYTQLPLYQVSPWQRLCVVVCRPCAD